ncbi:hypothetical protein L593_07380 [Salinarchaeum sp. Harcht-Bsk1]|uniref:DUF502 domain-containing protein n=1 Tax=Salinarchaeum sp. Harcht-Bsk1 TaxID=1333523 RepID=UPI000342437A|nr:DUF502 domain-containing protein [Salinarchaeum sp. Harcht-Bsk1]AGN01421.1 hypothetical protein L593_07380 [Salinarchaeum sp. Harcht-Bsk1]
MATWKRDFASGLVVLVPIIVTIWVVLWVYGIIANAPFLAAVDASLLESFGIENVPVELVRVVVTLVVFTLLVLGVGYLMRTAVGNLFESALDRLVNQVPGLRVVYNASKMAAETALTGTQSLQTPVKVEPWDGMRLTAFKTGKQTPDGRELLFMPTAPNITTGFVVEVAPEDITETDEGVETALTRLLSAGFGDEEEASSRVLPSGVTEEDVSEALDDADAEEEIGIERSAERRAGEVDATPDE